MTISELISRDRLQFQAYLILSIIVVSLTGMTDAVGSRPFERFIGSIDPLFAGLLIVILGAVLLTVLLSSNRFAIYKNENKKGLYLSSGLAALLGIVMILVDLKIVFPADTNAAFPASMAFYPAIGFIVEILFHILPLTLLMVTLTYAFKGAAYEHILWISILLVALLEPLYQVLWMGSRFPVWAVAYVGLHVFVINLLQLLIFKKYDFISMYAFRLVYYLFWHIGWGYFRLKVLF